MAPRGADHGGPPSGIAEPDRRTAPQYSQQKVQVSRVLPARQKPNLDGLSRKLTVIADFDRNVY